MGNHKHVLPDAFLVIVQNKQGAVVVTTLNGIDCSIEPVTNLIMNENYRRNGTVKKLIATLELLQAMSMGRD